jgi:hypothetical protein
VGLERETGIPKEKENIKASKVHKGCRAIDID